MLEYEEMAVAASIENKLDSVQPTLGCGLPSNRERRREQLWDTQVLIDCGTHPDSEYFRVIYQGFDVDTLR